MECLILQSTGQFMLSLVLQAFRVVGFGTFLVGLLTVAACNSTGDPEYASNSLPTLSSMVSSGDPGIPGTEMTWEGCLLTPGCSDDGDDYGVWSRVHDSDLSYSLFDPNTPDPSPGADGIWIGFEATDCYLMYAGSDSTLMTDQDDDGLRDECEYRLAKAFAPLLNMSEIDQCPAGEPYWAAKFINNLMPFGTGDMVKLAYLPAYYADCGDVGGHNADSEFIQITVAFNPATHHWELINSWLSAHACNDLSSECIGSTFASGFSSHSTWGPIFEFPSGRARSFPRVYVSRGKHANYRSRSACSAGGAFGQDDCAVDADVGRFMVWQDRNLGSARYPLRDCVQSYSDLEERAGTECFWTSEHFTAWQPLGDGVTPYKVLLNSLVFQGTMVSAGTWWIGSYGH